jgi:hypothetical protein
MSQPFSTLEILLDDVRVFQGPRTSDSAMLRIA